MNDGSESEHRNYTWWTVICSILRWSSHLQNRKKYNDKENTGCRGCESRAPYKMGRQRGRNACEREEDWRLRGMEKQMETLLPWTSPWGCFYKYFTKSMYLCVICVFMVNKDLFVYLSTYLLGSPMMVPRAPRGTEKPSLTFTTRSNIWKVTVWSGGVLPWRGLGWNTSKSHSRSWSDLMLPSR